MEIRVDVSMGPVPGHERLAGSFLIPIPADMSDDDIHRHAQFQLAKKLQAMFLVRDGRLEPTGEVED